MMRARGSHDILELRPAYRHATTLGPSHTTARTFLDFIVSGTSLHQLLGKGDVSPFVVGIPAELVREAIDRLLLLRAADFPAGRRSLYLCGECGDLGCGAASVVICRSGCDVIWKDFGFESSYDEVVLSPYPNIGPYTFRFEEYEQVLMSVPGMLSGLESER